MLSSSSQIAGRRMGAPTSLRVTRERVRRLYGPDVVALQARFPRVLWGVLTREGVLWHTGGELPSPEREDAMLNLVRVSDESELLYLEVESDEPRVHDVLDDLSVLPNCHAARRFPTGTTHRHQFVFAPLGRLAPVG